MTPDEKQPNKGHSTEINISPQLLAMLCLLIIIFYWVFCFLWAKPLPEKIELLLYFAHWASVGGLIGFAISRKSYRGIFIGAIIGAILSKILML